MAGSIRHGTAAQSHTIPFSPLKLIHTLRSVARFDSRGRVARGSPIFWRKNLSMAFHLPQQRVRDVRRPSVAEISKRRCPGDLFEM